MAEYYFSVNLDNDRALCIAPLTARHVANANCVLDDESGYFLYEQRKSRDFSNIEVIARVVSEDAVFKLRDMLKMS